MDTSACSLFSRRHSYYHPTLPNPHTQLQERPQCLCLAISSHAPSGASSVCYFLTRSLRSVLSVMLSALPFLHLHLRELHQCATSSHAASGAFSVSCSLPCHFLTRTFGSIISVPLPHTQLGASQSHVLCLAISSHATSGASSVCHFLTRRFRSILSVMLSALPFLHLHLREHHQCATSSHAASEAFSVSCSLPCHFLTRTTRNVISVTHCLSRHGKGTRTGWTACLWERSSLSWSRKRWMGKKQRAGEGCGEAPGR